MMDLCSGLDVKIDELS